MSEDSIRRSDAINELMHIIPYKHYHNGEYVFLLDKRECLAAIKAIPSADRPQGEWIFDDPLRADFECSECLERSDICTPFCPNCGARMKGGK